jgi:hypothetical protein
LRPAMKNANSAKQPKLQARSLPAVNTRDIGRFCAPANGGSENVYSLPGRCRLLDGLANHESTMARRIGSVRTSYASRISRKRAVASGEGLTSGCRRLASEDVHAYSLARSRAPVVKDPTGSASRRPSTGCRRGRCARCRRRWRSWARGCARFAATASAGRRRQALRQPSRPPWSATPRETPALPLDGEMYMRYYAGNRAASESGAYPLRRAGPCRLPVWASGSQAVARTTRPGFQSRR